MTNIGKTQKKTGRSCWIDTEKKTSFCVVCMCAPRGLQITPDTAAMISMVNFSITRSGLVRGGPFQLYLALSCLALYLVLSCLVLTASAIKLSSQEDQLLSKTITAEQPELEKRKSEILQQEEELKVQLVNYEKSLLEVKNERASIEKLSFSCSFFPLLV
jgi:hypothetical protein